jgi:transglycosylase-like protein with SLT domain
MLVDGTSNAGTAPAVTGAIRNAAQATGTSFEYLLATAQVESGFNPTASASTSSAGGLYQFIDQTWLGTLKDAGPSLGYGRFADAITKSPSGQYEVSDPSMRREIMALRQDPAANAAMAGAFTQHNAATLAAQLGRPVSEGELYVAHFLGPGGAAKLITTAATSPQANAAALFPSAAAANRSIFYDRQGAPRSVADVYGQLVQRYDTARAGPATLAASTAPPRPPAEIPPVAAASAGTGDPGAKRPMLPAVFDATTAAQTANVPPVFHSLFRSDETRSGIAPVVQELWGTAKTSSPAGASQAVTPASSSATTTGLLDLYSDQPANVRALFGKSS